MQLSEFRSRPEMVTHASLLLLVAPVWFASAAILKHYFGIGFFFAPFELLLSFPATRTIFNLISPLVFLGSLGLVLLLNFIAIFDVKFDIRQQSVSGQLAMNARLSNVLLLAVTSVTLAIFLTYALVENYLIVAR